MKKRLFSTILTLLLLSASSYGVQGVAPTECASNPAMLSQNTTVVLSAVGQGVSPSTTISPAQSYALAKRAAIADAYRQLAEKLQGVRVEGRDYIKNMVVKRSEVKTSVAAMIRDSEIVETNFKDGLCEVNMELQVVGQKWYKELAGK